MLVSCLFLVSVLVAKGAQGLAEFEGRQFEVSDFDKANQSNCKVCLVRTLCSECVICVSSASIPHSAVWLSRSQAIAF